MERVMKFFIGGKLDNATFIKTLVLSYERGGVGVPEREARRMAKISSQMLHQADDIRRFRNGHDKDHVFFDQHKLSERLRDHLLMAHRMTLTSKQDANLVETIADRVVGVINEDVFHMRLQESVKSGGLSLTDKESDDVARYFEKLIAQGVDVSYKS